MPLIGCIHLLNILVQALWGWWTELELGRVMVAAVQLLCTRSRTRECCEDWVGVDAHGRIRSLQQEAHCCKRFRQNFFQNWFAGFLDFFFKELQPCVFIDPCSSDRVMQPSQYFTPYFSNCILATFLYLRIPRNDNGPVMPYFLRPDCCSKKVCYFQWFCISILWKDFRLRFGVFWNKKVVAFGNFWSPPCSSLVFFFHISYIVARFVPVSHHLSCSESLFRIRESAKLSKRSS